MLLSSGGQNSMAYHARVARLLEVADLTVHYDGGAAPAAAVRDVTLSMEEGEAVGLLGESGCGKSTLLLAILGLLPPAARIVRGSVRFRGRDLLALSEGERRRLRGAEIALVFQDPALALNPVRRVGARWRRSWPRIGAERAPLPRGRPGRAGRRSGSRKRRGCTTPIPTS